MQPGVGVAKDVQKLPSEDKFACELNRLCGQSQATYKQFGLCATLGSTNRISSRSRSRERDGVAMVQQFRKSITALVFFLAPAPPWRQAPRSAAGAQAGRSGPLRRGPGRHALGHLPALHRFAVALARAVGHEQDQIQQPPPDLPRVRASCSTARAARSDRRAGRVRRTSGSAGTRPADAARPAPRGAVKLGPRVRAESLARQEIPSIPPAAIEPFLTRPLVIEPDGLDKAPTIVATQKDRVILAAGNRAYVRGIGRRQGRYLVRVPPRRSAGRSRHQPDARLRGDLSRHRAAHAARAIRPRWC